MYIGFIVHVFYALAATRTNICIHALYGSCILGNGSDIAKIVLHYSEDAKGLSKKIKEAGMKVGVALKPGTAVDDAIYALVSTCSYQPSKMCLMSK